MYKTSMQSNPFSAEKRKCLARVLTILGYMKNNALAINGLQIDLPALCINVV